MRLFTPRRIVALAALAPALFLFSAVPGCSNQSEGERCGDDIAPNNDDCTAPLVCVVISAGIDRCCNPSPSIVNDSRCLRSNEAVGGSGGSATAGTGGSGGSSSAGTGGTTDLGGTGGVDMNTAGMSSGGI